MLYNVTSRMQHFYNTVHILWTVHAINPVSANKCFLKHLNSDSSLLYVMNCTVFTVYTKIHSLFFYYSLVYYILTEVSSQQFYLLPLLPASPPCYLHSPPDFPFPRSSLPSENKACILETSNKPSVYNAVSLSCMLGKSFTKWTAFLAHISFPSFPPPLLLNF